MRFMFETGLWENWGSGFISFHFLINLPIGMIKEGHLRKRIKKPADAGLR